MVKFGVMSSSLPNPNNNDAQSVGTSVTGAAPTFSPLYQQIKALITRRLESGEWKPGELIPSEVELGSRFKVSQGTVRKAIDELDEAYREIVLMRFVEDLPPKDIARITGLSENVVSVRIHRGVEKLRTLLGPTPKPLL